MEFANLETLMPTSQFGAFIDAAAQAVTVMDAAKVIVDEVSISSCYLPLAVVWMIYVL
jgi:hypothetical protein